MVLNIHFHLFFLYKIVPILHYLNHTLYHLFLHLLIKANFTDKEWRGIKIKRGQFLTGRKKLSEETGLTEMQVRTALNHLKISNDITIETTKQYSIITIKNYDDYQHNDQQSNQQNNQAITTTNKDNKENNIYSDDILSKFDEFYNIYPRKIAKQNALKSYARALKDTDSITILNALKKYKFSSDTQYIPHPATWLNQKRWNDIQEIKEVKYNAFA